MKTPADRDTEQRQRSYVRADVQRGTRQRMTDYGPERIGRSTLKPLRLVHQRCRLRVRCDGTADLELMRRQAGMCLHCARFMGADKRRDESIGQWLRRVGQRETTVELR